MNYLYISNYNELSIRHEIPSFVQLFFWTYGDYYCEYSQELEPYSEWIIDRILDKNVIRDSYAIKAYLYMKYNRNGVIWDILSYNRSSNGGYDPEIESLITKPVVKRENINLDEEAERMTIRQLTKRLRVGGTVLYNKKRKKIKNQLKNAHINQIINTGVVHDKKENREVFSKVMKIESDLYKAGFISPRLKNTLSIYLPSKMTTRNTFYDIYQDLDGFIGGIISAEGWLFDNQLSFATQLVLFELGYITIKKVVNDRNNIIKAYPILRDELECYSIGMGAAHKTKCLVICVSSSFEKYVISNGIKSVNSLQYHVINKLKYDTKLYNECVSIVNIIYEYTS